MGNAAVLLKKLGHEVAGSDAGVYPPMSDVLSQACITLFEGFNAEELREWKPDRVVVGNAVSRGNAQVEDLLGARDLPSAPSSVDRGGFDWSPGFRGGGRNSWKTTTTALTAYSLKQLQSDPGYLVGGVPLDLPSGNEIGELQSPL